MLFPSSPTLVIPIELTIMARIYGASFVTKTNGHLSQIAHHYNRYNHYIAIQYQLKMIKVTHDTVWLQYQYISKVENVINSHSTLHKKNHRKNVTRFAKTQHNGAY